MSQISPAQIPPAEIRTARAKRPRIYARDFAEEIGISEATLCAAFVGISATRISARPEDILPRLSALGTVMALTRNDSCVLEKVGIYDNFSPGPEVATVSNGTIALHLAPAQWVHAFALDEPGPKGPKRSVQIFDATGEAVHKIHLREETHAEAWAPLVAALRLADQEQSLALAPRGPVAPPQSMRSGQQLAAGSVEKLMYRAAEKAVALCITVGNPGCTEIHSGPIVRVLESGPWINVLDPGLELHLRMDHISEVWAEEAVEALDSSGAVIARFSAVAGAEPDWAELLAELAPVAAQ